MSFPILSLAASSYTPGEIILKLASDSNTLENLAKIGIRPVFPHLKKMDVKSGGQTPDLSTIYLMDVPEGQEQKYCTLYSKEVGVIYAEPNYLQHLCITPNDDAYAQQWNLPMISAESAWNLETGSENIVLAVVDTGIDYQHLDLSANIWRNAAEIAENGIDDDGNGYVDDVIGWDFVDAAGGASGEDVDTPDNDPMDRHSHGTHVAGIAGAVSDNAEGIAGVSWKCKVMAIRAGYKTASGDGALESDDAAQGIVYAAQNGAKVINLSWGNTQKSSLIEDAIQFATGLGALICAAAGNSGSEDPLYPAALDNPSIIAVGSTDSYDTPSSFSNFGDWVHVSAPGSSIYSTYLNNGYTTMSGTSMATPHVTGLAGLVMSRFPDLSPLEVKTKIMRSADIIQALDGKNMVSGRINAHTALSDTYTTPHIFSLMPDMLHEGDVLSLFGDRFGETQDGSYVTFMPGIQGEVFTWTDSRIQVSVPEGALSGSVTVTTDEGVSNPAEMTILPGFYRETLLANSFQGIGTPQGWQADDQTWEYQLPFTFTFFGREYDRVYICSNGYLDFTDSAVSYLNSDEALKTRVMIAPLWDDLVTNGLTQADEDVYVDDSSDDAVSFRWVAESYETGAPVNVETILYLDGRIQFNYGEGNENLSPTVGISGGGGNNYHFSTYSGKSCLRQAESVVFSPVEQTFKIILDMGWNLISLPLEMENNQVDQIIGGVQEIESVWGYEDGIWYVYDPQNPGLSDLESLKTGCGYWAKATKGGVIIEIRGKVSSQSLNLENGWNLVGFDILQSLSANEALQFIENTVQTLWGYKDGEWHVYCAQSPELSNLDLIEPGKGYWVETGTK